MPTATPPHVRNVAVRLMERTGVDSKARPRYSARKQLDNCGSRAVMDIMFIFWKATWMHLITPWKAFGISDSTWTAMMDGIEHSDIPRRVDAGTITRW